MTATAKDRNPDLRNRRRLAFPWLGFFSLNEQLSLAFEIAEQDRERHAERRRHFCDVLEAEIAFAAFDGAHEGPVHAAFVSEGFLGIALLRSEFSNALSQGLQEQI